MYLFFLPRRARERVSRVQIAAAPAINTVNAARPAAAKLYVLGTHTCFLGRDKHLPGEGEEEKKNEIKKSFSFRPLILSER